MANNDRGTPPEQQLKAVLLDYVMPAMVGLLGYIWLNVTTDVDLLLKRVQAVEVEQGKQDVRIIHLVKRLDKIED